MQDNMVICIGHKSHRQSVVFNGTTEITEEADHGSGNQDVPSCAHYIDTYSEVGDGKRQSFTNRKTFLPSELE